MPFVDGFVQGKHDPGFDARRMVSRQSKCLGNAICGFETHAVDIAFELVWILLNNLQSRITIGLVNLDRQIGAHAVTMQEHHDLLDLLLLLPSRDDLLRAVRANARHFEQTFRCGFDHIEGFFLKTSDDTLR